MSVDIVTKLCGKIHRTAIAINVLTDLPTVQVEGKVVVPTSAENYRYYNAANPYDRFVSRAFYNFTQSLKHDVDITSSNIFGCGETPLFEVYALNLRNDIVDALEIKLSHCWSLSKVWDNEVSQAFAAPKGDMYWLRDEQALVVCGSYSSTVHMTFRCNTLADGLESKSDDMQLYVRRDPSDGQLHADIVPNDDVSQVKLLPWQIYIQ